MGKKRKLVTPHVLNSEAIQVAWDDCAHAPDMNPHEWRTDAFGVPIERKRLCYADCTDKQEFGDYVPLLISRDIFNSRDFKEACQEIAAQVRRRLHDDLRRHSGANP